MNRILELKQIDEIRKYVEKDVVSHIRTGRVDRFASFDHFDMISFDWIDVENSNENSSHTVIYFDKQDLFILCEKKKCFEAVQKMIPETASSEKALQAFFVGIIKNDMDYLDKLEDDITQTEDDLLTSTKMEYSHEIIQYRKELLRLKRYYEQLISVFDGLTDNENKIISEDTLRQFKILNNRINRLFSTVLNLRDYVTQVREAYQARIDIEQNNLMKTFTVITSIFLPLTLIAGWYGMNLRMPEYGLKYGYAIVIGISIIVCAACVIFFKRKKWF